MGSRIEGAGDVQRLHFVIIILESTKEEFIERLMDPIEQAEDLEKPKVQPKWVEIEKVLNQQAHNLTLNEEPETARAVMEAM